MQTNLRELESWLMKRIKRSHLKAKVIVVLEIVLNPIQKEKKRRRKVP